MSRTVQDLHSIAKSVHKTFVDHNLEAGESIYVMSILQEFITGQIIELKFQNGEIFRPAIEKILKEQKGTS